MKSVLSYAASALMAASFATAAPQFSSQAQEVRLTSTCGFDCTRNTDVPLNGQFVNIGSSEPGDISFLGASPPGTVCEVFDGNQAIGTVPTRFNRMTGVECISQNGGNGNAPPAPQQQGGGQNVRVTASFGFDTTIQREIPVNNRREALFINEPGSISFIGGQQPPPGARCVLFDNGREVGQIPTRFQRVTEIGCGF
jgi:hypothetical protein